MTATDDAWPEVWSDALDAVAVPVLVCDHDGNRVAANAVASVRLGLDANGGPLAAAVGDVASHQLLGALERALADATTIADLSVVLRPASAPAWRASATVRPLPGADAAVVTLVPAPVVAPPGASTVAERLLGFTRDNITLVDRSGRIRVTKGMYAHVQGYEPDFWVGAHVSDLLPDDARELLAEVVPAVVAEPGAVVEREVDVVAADGKVVRLAVLITNCLDDPLLEGVVVVTRDVTEERAVLADISRRHRQAETVADARNQLLATVSHELRNPLHGVRGLAEMLVQEELGESAAALAATIVRQLTGLAQIAEDLLDTARFEAGRPVLRPVATELSVLVADVVDLARYGLDDRPVDVTASIDGDVAPWVLVDAGRLRQVLTNLLGNAIKFTPAGRVELAVRRPEPDVVTFSVRDTGIGIPAEEQDAIFEPFGVASTAGDARGAGLGLSIVARLVAAMDGTVELTSEIGSGTHIEIWLPLVACDPPVRTEFGVSLPVGLRVLVVEDHPVNQQLAQSQLERLSLSPTIVGTGEEAIGVLFDDAEAPFDVVLMDEQLPGMSGSETSRRIRAAEGPRARTPIVGLSASASVAEHDAFRAAGMDEFIAKPASLRDLATAISAVLRPDVEPEAAPVDVDGLARLADELGDVNLVHELVTIYLADLDDRVAAIVADDPDAAHRAAHSLKSSSRLLGANRLADACVAVERGGPPTAAPGLARLAEEVRDALTEWLATSSTGRPDQPRSSV